MCDFCVARDQTRTEDGDGSDLADFPSFPKSLWMMSWMDLVFQLSFIHCTDVPCTCYIAWYHVLGAGGLKVSELRQGSCLQGAPSLSKSQKWIRWWHKPGIHKLWPVGQIWLSACFCMAHESRMIYIFNGWKRIKRKLTFHDMEKLLADQISGSTNKVLLEHRHARAFSYCPWLILLHRDRVE